MVVSFTDSDGIEWMVTEINDPGLRLIPPELLRSPEFRGGWLLFQAASAKRRLAPFPENWRELSEPELERLCARARPALAGSRTPVRELPRYPG